MRIENTLMENGTLGMQIESPSKIPAEAYVKTIPREAFYKEELYKRICCVNVTECS